MNKAERCLRYAYELGYRCNENGEVISPLNRNLKLWSNKKGYLFFSVKLKTDLHYKPISKGIPVHRLQAYQKYGNEIFLSEKHIRHLNGLNIDNSVNNIGIGSVLDNIMDIPQEIRLSKAIHASTRTRKFTDIEMDEIKMFHEKNKSYKKTMEKFNISSKGTLHNMLNVVYQTTVN